MGPTSALLLGSQSASRGWRLLGAVGQPELGEDVLHVVLGGALGEVSAVALSRLVLPAATSAATSSSRAGRGLSPATPSRDSSIRSRKSRTPSRSAVGRAARRSVRARSTSPGAPRARLPQRRCGPRLLPGRLTQEALQFQALPGVLGTVQDLVPGPDGGDVGQRVAGQGGVGGGLVTVGIHGGAVVVVAEVRQLAVEAGAAGMVVGGRASSASRPRSRISGSSTDRASEIRTASAMRSGRPAWRAAPAASTLHRTAAAISSQWRRARAAPAARRYRSRGSVAGPPGSRARSNRQQGWRLVDHRRMGVQGPLGPVRRRAARARHATARHHPDHHDRVRDVLRHRRRQGRRVSAPAWATVLGRLARSWWLLALWCFAVRPPLGRRAEGARPDHHAKRSRRGRAHGAPVTG